MFEEYKGYQVLKLSIRKVEKTMSPPEIATLIIRKGEHTFTFQANVCPNFNLPTGDVDFKSAYDLMTAHNYESKRWCLKCLQCNDGGLYEEDKNYRY